MVAIINRPLLVIYLLLATACSMLGNQPISMQIQNLYQNGSNAFQQGAYKKAESLWQQELTLATKRREMNKWTADFLIGLARVAEIIPSHIR